MFIYQKVIKYISTYIFYINQNNRKRLTDTTSFLLAKLNNPSRLKVKMVCEKCEKKLAKVITPDPWKSGARNTTESGGRKLNENKALTGSKHRYDPVGETFRPCR